MQRTSPYRNVLYSYYPHMPIGKVWIYQLLFVFLRVCTFMNFFSEDKASGVLFCTAVHRRPRQGICHFGELCSPNSPKSVCGPIRPIDMRHSRNIPRRGHRIGMCHDVWIYDRPRRWTYLSNILVLLSGRIKAHRHHFSSLLFLFPVFCTTCNFVSPLFRTRDGYLIFSWHTGFPF